MHLPQAVDGVADGSVVAGRAVRLDFFVHPIQGANDGHCSVGHLAEFADGLRAFRHEKDLHPVDVFLCLHPVHEGAAQDGEGESLLQSVAAHAAPLPLVLGNGPHHVPREVDVEPQEIHLLPSVTSVFLVKTMDGDHDDLGEGQALSPRIRQVGTDHGDPAVVDMGVFVGPQDQGQGFLPGISQFDACILSQDDVLFTADRP